MRGIAVPLVVGIVGLGLAAGASASLTGIEEARRDETHLLYLPNGKHLKIASLGHSALVADALYLWAIQYYSNYERGDRYRYVEHVFRDVITELDPHYVDAYWLGAMILSLEARDTDAALRLLDTGFERNPEEWVLPYLAGWECYYAGDFDRAGAYFEAASAVPGAPPRVRRAIGGMRRKSGNLRAALEAWEAILADRGADAVSRGIAERQVGDLRLRLDIGELEGAVAAFLRDNGYRPAALDRLVTGGYIASVPNDPAGQPYEYDASSGRVSSTAVRVLGSQG